MRFKGIKSSIKSPEQKQAEHDEFMRNNEWMKEAAADQLSYDLSIMTAAGTPAKKRKEYYEFFTGKKLNGKGVRT